MTIGKHGARNDGGEAHRSDWRMRVRTAATTGSQHFFARGRGLCRIAARYSLHAASSIVLVPFSRAL